MEFKEKEIVLASIIDLLGQTSRGRLIIYKDEKKPFLVVEEKREYKKQPIFLQVEEVYFLKDNLFEKKVQTLDFQKNLYLLFVYFDKISFKLGDFCWIIPSYDFKELSPDLNFSSFYDQKTEDRFSSYLVKKEKVAQILLNILRDPEFRIAKRPEAEKIIISEFKNFLILARKKTYASGSLPALYPHLLGSKEYSFQEKNYFYRDIYFEGENKFFGQEVIYKDNRPIWTMIYAGNQAKKHIFEFLKEVLTKLADKTRLGQESFYEDSKKQLKYYEKGEGDITNFEGKEQIYEKEIKVYELFYRGGFL